MTAGSSTLTVINHNLESGDYILIEDATGITDLNGIVTRVAEPVDANTFTVTDSFTGTYSGSGRITRISNLNITSKQWNPGTPIGQQFRMPYIDFLLDRTSDGEVSVDYFTDSNSSPVSDRLLGSNVLYTRSEDSGLGSSQGSRLWHRYFLESEGYMIQIKITFSDAQLRDLDIVRSEFQLNGMILYVEPEGRITG
jgi:hypothetical protein